jgi:signal transduction histidine kinase/CheY-like chemotaxis protein
MTDTPAHTSQSLPSRLRGMLSSVRGVMFLLVVLATIFPLGTLLYQGYERGAAALSEGKALSERIASEVVFDQKNLLSSAQQLMSTFSYIPAIRRREAGPANAILADLLKKNPQITNLGVVDEKGNSWASAIPPKVPFNTSDRRYFRNALATGRFSSGEFNIGRILNKPALLFGYPLKDESGRITDVAIVSFNLDTYERHFRSKGLAKEASLALFDHKGTLFFGRPTMSLIGTHDREDLFRKMVTGPDEGSFESVGLTGVHRVFTYRKLRLPGEAEPYMYVRAGVSVDSLMAETRSHFLLGLVSIGGAGLLMVLTSVLLGKRFILDKVEALKGATRRIAAGDLSTRVPEVVSGGELGELGDAFDAMARRLEHADADRQSAEEANLNLERQVQRAQKMESLGIFAGGIAHDFNNLLMIVLGHAELAMKGIPPTSAAARSISEITIAANRAANLSLQMLTYSGKAVSAKKRVGLRELIEEMEPLLKSAISKKTTLTLDLGGSLPPVEADPSQIRQIVMNLATNASEAIGDQGGEITMTAGSLPCDAEYLRNADLHDGLAPGEYVFLEVADNGIGMDAGTLTRIFDPFFSTKFTGRGLGLASVLGIVRAHKGGLTVRSDPGKGTTFRVLFPARKETAEEILAPAPPSPADWRGKGTILLVDDEESLLALGKRMLEQLGFTVLTATDGLQAVDLYREQGKGIDLVLMDLTMPHMDGVEAFGELRRLNPDVRVIVVTGYRIEEVAMRFAGKDLDGILQKPFTLDKLREAVAGLLPAR